MSLPVFISEPNPEIYLSDNYIVVDVETTNLDHGSPYEGTNQLLLAHWVRGKAHPHRKRDGRVGTHWGSEYEQSALLDDIARSDFVVAHFAKFELGWLARCGLDLRTVLPYCTQLGEYVLAGNRKFPGGFGLDATAARYGLQGKLRFVSSLIESGICPSEIPARSLAEYCAQDVETTEQIFLRQRRILGDFQLLPTAYARNLVSPVLVDIESRGMCLDPERVNAAYADYSARYNHLLADFAAVTGGINPRSGKQMREYLYAKLGFKEVTDHKGNPMRTSGGKKGEPQPRTDKKILPMLKADTDEQKAFKKLAIDIAKLKVPVQNLTKMKKIIDKGEQLVFASINQTVTDTHRFSSSGRRGGFQFHNFDRAFKPLFRARSVAGQDQPGVQGLMVEADAPQLEFRVAAHLGNDSAARRAVLDGEDVHAFTASVLGCSRQNAKEHTFKPLYGGNSGTAAEKRYYKAFREKYPDIYNTQKGWTYQVAKDKYLKTATGLRFYWPETRISSDGYISNSPSIFNYPVQSLATADIIPLTLVLVWHRLADLPGVTLVNTIHDSIIAEVDTAERVDEYVDVLVSSFLVDSIDLLNKLYGIKFSIPLGVGIKIGSHWGTGDERRFEPVWCTETCSPQGTSEVVSTVAHQPPKKAGDVAGAS